MEGSGNYGTDVEDESETDSQQRLRFKIVNSILDAGFTPGTLECHLLLEGRIDDDDEPLVRIVLRFRIDSDYPETRIPVYLGRIQDGIHIDDTEDNDMSHFYEPVNDMFEEGLAKMRESSNSKSALKQQ
jgi:hypothetical protein